MTNSPLQGKHTLRILTQRRSHVNRRETQATSRPSLLLATPSASTAQHTLQNALRSYQLMCKLPPTSVAPMGHPPSLPPQAEREWEGTTFRRTQVISGLFATGSRLGVAPRKASPLSAPSGARAELKRDVGHCVASRTARQLATSRELLNLTSQDSWMYGDRKALSKDSNMNRGPVQRLSFVACTSLPTRPG